jgi:selT/selW/selH-like putative selenoprotein
VRGSGGIFLVELDGQAIYSKHDTGRFPEIQEVLERIPAAT